MNTNTAPKVKWFHYIAAFFAGAVILNIFPHFIKGICGDPFPTPFSNPPGIGPSAPIVNIAWAFINMLIAFLLVRVNRKNYSNTLIIILTVVGFTLMAVQLSIHFAGKDLV